MPRGSRPGERRGGRKKGTPNKKTLLHNALIAAVAADPNLRPLDFFLRLMQQSTLPLAIRVHAAEEALPFVHPKPPRSAQGAGAKALTPLAFLRAVMRHRDTPMHLRLRVASILAPYLHAKATPEAESEAEFVVEDQYGFSVEPGLAKNLMDTEKALYELPHWWTKGEGSYEEQQHVLRKRLAPAKKSLRCPETYRWEDLAKDNGRLSQLAAKREAQGLTPPEDAEEVHLRARTFSHENSAEHAEREGRRDRRNALYAKWKDYSITEEEQQEFDDLRASLRDIDPDPVSWDFHRQVCLEARIRGLPEPTPEEVYKMLAAKNRQPT